jgi:hypothetical protein
MSLVGHLFWGLAFTKLFGFSFTVTKISVVVLHLVEGLVVLRLLALYGVSANLALAAALALIFNPLHFVHAFMYMTDVPALAWQVIAIYCFSKGLLSIEPDRDGSAEQAPRRPYRWLAAGSLAAGWAFLARQNGVLVPATLVLYLALFARRHATWRTILAAFGPVALVMAGFTLWYRTVHGPTVAYVNSLRDVTAFALHPPLAELPLIALSLLVYVGWFLIPLAAAVPVRAFRLPPRSAGIAFLCLSAVAVAALGYYALEEGKIFPYVWNVITPFGLYYSGEFIIGLRGLLWGKEIGLLIGSISLLSALVFVQRLLLHRWGRHAAKERIAASPVPQAPSSEVAFDRAGTMGMRFLLLLLALQLAYCFATAPILFDRHLLLFAPAAIVVFCLTCRRMGHPRLWRYLVFLFPLALYSVATTHDLHAISRTAFRAANDLIAEGVDPRQIVAGYSFDCWSTYDERSDKGDEYKPTPAWWRMDVWSERFFDGVQPQADPGFLWPPWAWWVGLLSSGIEKQYAVTCNPPPATPGVQPFEVYRRYPYSTWWPWRTNAVCVLRNRSTP